MRGRFSRLAIAGTLFSLGSVVPEVATGQSLAPELILQVHLVNRAPTVRSFARAILYDKDGDRIYNGQVILDHELVNSSYGFPLYRTRVVSEIGYANSGTGNRAGEEGHCYSARMAAHANAYSLHEHLEDTWRCMPEVPEDPEIPEENCPILLDLEQDGFRLSGPDPAVRFDIDADGVPDSIAWTSAGEDDAFLCLDRNGNGSIDNGVELFGFSTPLLSGQPARVGYRALADLDQAESGGNGDGKIDSADQAFHQLCVWTDRDRDGVSDSGEVQGLWSAGVDSLDYNYRVTDLRDTFGNLFRYVSRVRMRSGAGTARSWPTFDVIFIGAAQ